MMRSIWTAAVGFAEVARILSLRRECEVVIHELTPRRKHEGNRVVVWTFIPVDVSGHNARVW